jgi:regulator of RNase E activity RraA
MPTEAKPAEAKLAEAKLAEALGTISTATLTSVLSKKGLRNVFMRGTRPLHPQQPRCCGRAFTLRFVPAREDLATPAALASPTSTRTAIEAMPAGSVAVVDAMGVTDAGIFGDILCARMYKRGVAGLITDGVVRDLAGVLATGLPVWCQGTAAPPSFASLTFVGWQQPIGCGGVAVLPDDMVVADGDGAVVIPAALVAEVVAAASEQGAARGLDPARGQRRSLATRALSAECGQPGPLRRRRRRPWRGGLRSGLKCGRFRRRWRRAARPRAGDVFAKARAASLVRSADRGGRRRQSHHAKRILGRAWARARKVRLATQTCMAP